MGYVTESEFRHWKQWMIFCQELSPAPTGLVLPSVYYCMAMIGFYYLFVHLTCMVPIYKAYRHLIIPIGLSS